MDHLKTLLLIPYAAVGLYLLKKKSNDFWAFWIGKNIRTFGKRVMNPKAQAFLAFIKRLTPNEQPALGHYRESFTKLARLTKGPTVPIQVIENHSIETPSGPLDIRIYDNEPSDSLRPGFYFLHGGGFMIGNLKTHDDFCRRLARDTGRRVFALDYRLAPEHPFPAAPIDTLAVWDWVCRNGHAYGFDYKRIVVGGDSAGAFLALTVGKFAHRYKAAPEAIVAIYPPAYPVPDTESRATLASENVILTKDVMDRFTAAYMQGRDQSDDPLATLPDRKLPRTYLMTCGFDPLRDEGLMIARALKAHGTQIVYTEKEGFFHNYIISSGIFPEVDELTKEIAAFLDDSQFRSDHDLL